MLIKIIAIIITVIGAIVNFMSNKIIDRYSLSEREICKFENKLSQEELIEYKLNKANIKVKLIGLAIALPGIITIIKVF